MWGAAREVVRGPTAGVVRVFALGRYRGVGRKLLIAYKERGRRDLAASLGRVLAEALAELPLGSGGLCAAGLRSSPEREVTSASVAATVPARVNCPDSAPGRPPAGSQAATMPRRAVCLVPAPSRRSAARVRGGPHIERLANAAASVLAARGIEVTVAPALELTGGVRDAVGLGREQRMANLAGHLRLREAGRPPPGVPIVVLDDVVTTGATAAACTQALAAAGFTVSAVLTLLAAG